MTGLGIVPRAPTAAPDDRDSVPRGIGESGSWDLRAHAAAVYRRRWWVVAIAGSAIAIGAVYLSLAVPVYVARAKLLIESQSPNIVSFKEVVEQNTTRLDYYETQLGILRSRTLARKTLDQLNLWDYPELAAHQSMFERIRQRVGVDAVAAAFTRRAGSTPAIDETAAQSRTIDEFLGRLRILYRADNRLVDVGFESADPRVAANVANALARAYIDQNLELKVRGAKEASAWLGERLAEQKAHVEAGELSLQQYRERNADVAVSGRQNVTVQRLAELSTAATRAKTDRIEIEALSQQLHAALESPLSGAVPVSLNTPLIQQLKSDLVALQREEAQLSERFGSRHPDLLKVRASMERTEGQLRDELSKLSESVRNQLTSMKSKEDSLTGALAAQERRALALDGRAMQYGTLQRELESNRQLFDALMERAKQTQIASELKIANVQIIDPAEVPRLPSAPRPVLALVVALFLGLPLGIVAALFLEYLDERLKSPDDIRTRLGLTVLGLVPRVGGCLPRASLSLMNSEMPVEFAEAVRGLRASVLLAMPEGGTQSVVVTSTRPGEGKTVVAANLAVALAQAGRRVLLVDADMRKRQIHDMFGLREEPGLAGVLDDALPIGGALQPVPIRGLIVLPAGVPRISPGDLLEKKGLRGTLAPVRGQFDWIVIDAPPVMAASDTTSLAHDANAVIFVVDADTSWRHARTALEPLEAGRVHIAGAVMSRVRMQTLPRHYSAYYSYGEGERAART